MNKKILSAMTTALVVGATSTTFAAANPFSDVPAGHWAYDAVTQLAADGIVEGYGDGTYLGNRNITRYEMAQMIAKALAKNPTGADKAALDRLAAEFSEELNNLGVRVSNLEKYADKVKWSGKIEYTYTSARNGDAPNKTKENENGFVFRFEPEAEVNDHWALHARIDADADMKHDETSTFAMKRGWAEGDYDKFNVKVGKMELFTNENGLVFDDEFSGASVTIGSKLKFTAFGGRLDISDTGFSEDMTNLVDDMESSGIFSTNTINTYRRLSDDTAASIWGVNAQYDADKGFYGGAGFYQLRSDTYAIVTDKKRNNIWSVNAGYAFTDKLNLWGAYARADAKGIASEIKSEARNSWQVELDYGDYEDASEKGQWSVYAAYRRYGYLSSVFPTGDGVDWGQKGVEFGVNYAPMKNIGLLAKYFDGKNLGDDSKAKKLFGRVEFFF